MPEPTWSLVQYTVPGSDRVRLGVRTGDTVREPPNSWPPTALDLLDRWTDHVQELRTLDATALTRVERAHLAAPITYPRKLICAGANYYSHAAEMGSARPDPTRPPFFFLKPPTTTVLGPDAVAPLPSGPDPQYDWEVELGIVIGRRGKQIPADAAADYIAGYVVANDLSARGRFERTFATAPFDWDWLAQKNQDGSCPIGPGIVPAWLVPHLEEAGISLTVNGQTKQDSSMSDIVIGVAGLVAAASSILTLEPGDIILAGTPAGVGLPRNTFLCVGDTVEATIDGLGTLRHTIGPPRDADLVADPTNRRRPEETR